MLTRALKRTVDAHTCESGECELNATALRAAYGVEEETFYGTIGLDEYGMNEGMPSIQVQNQLGYGGSFIQVPAIPQDKIPDNWTIANGTIFPRWPARSWSEAKTDFINSYCGSVGVFIDTFTMMKVSLERAENHFVDFGTSSDPEPGDVAECIPCPRGRSRSSSFAECYQCAAGTFAAELGQAECDLCPVGSAVGSLGALQCENCTTGRVAGELGRKSCQQCEQGRFISQEGQSECESCPVGRYQPDMGQSECLACIDPDGLEITTQFLGSTDLDECICPTGTFRYDDNESCQECPAGMVFESDALWQGGTKIYPCSCPEGSYLGSSGCGFLFPCECLPCPDSMTCPAGVGTPSLEPGNWAHTSDDESRRYSVYRCRNQGQCPGGPAGTCAWGRDPDTVGCAACLAGYVPAPSGDKCFECQSTDYLPIVFAILLMLVGAGILVLYSRVDVAKTSLNTVVGLAICGQLVVVTQWFSVFNDVEVQWVEPFNFMVRFAAVFSLNFEYMKIGCFLRASSEVTIFAVRLLCFPIMSGCLVLLMFIHSKFNGFPLNLDQVVNSVGLILMILFLALSLIVVSPFMCVDSPNGTKSMSSNPSVICGDNDDFIALSVLAVIGLLVYSVTPMALVSHVTYRYPAIVASGQADIILTRYRFLFQRFRVQRYYYGPIFLFRNFMMALVPVIFSNLPHLQVIVLAGLLIFFGQLSCSMHPWRGKPPNYIEALLIGFMIVSLMVAGILIEVDNDEVTTDLQAILVIVLVGMAVPLFGFVGQLVYKSLRASSQTYGIFLSHHKLGMAAGARLVKMELARRTGKRIFLDSDELDDLDCVLDTVRNGTECLVVLLTTDTLWRPWCAGEITIAHISRTPIICLSSDGYVEPSDEDLEEKSLSERWSVDQFAPMALEGVTFEAVHEAYLALRGQSKVEWRRAGSSASPQLLFQTAVEETIVRFNDAAGRSRSNRASTPGINRASTPLIVDATKAELVVVANGDDGEAVSSAQVLAVLIRTLMQWHTLVALSTDHLNQDHTPIAVVVSLTSDALRSEEFVRTIIAVRSAFGGEPYFMTTRSADFQFPAAEVLESTKKKLAASMGVLVEEIHATFAPMLSSLALPFFPGTRESLVMAEAKSIAARLARHGERSTNNNSQRLRTPRHPEASPPKR